MRHLLFACLGIGLLLSPPLSAEETQTDIVINFGIVPQQSASRLAQMWGPFLDALGQETGATIQFQTAKDIPTFEACLAAGAYDVAYMNPMHYAIFSEEAGYRAFARQAKKQLKGILVVSADADLTDLAGLQGAEVAFPSPGAFGASILPRATLTDMGVDFEPVYVNSHDSVYRAVASGLMQAGGGVVRTLGAVDPAIRDSLHIIFETEAFTPHAFAVNAYIDAAFIDLLQASFLEIGRTQPDLVSGIGMVGLTTAQDQDWDDVRALDMPREASGILAEGERACPSG